MGSPHSSRQPNNRYIFFFTFLYHQLIPGVANCKNAPPDSFAMPLGWPRKDNLMSTLPGMRREPHMFSMMKASSKGQVTSLASNFKSKKKKKNSRYFCKLFNSFHFIQYQNQIRYGENPVFPFCHSAPVRIGATLLSTTVPRQGSYTSLALLTWHQYS